MLKINIALIIKCEKTDHKIQKVGSHGIKKQHSIPTDSGQLTDASKPLTKYCRVILTQKGCHRGSKSTGLLTQRLKIDIIPLLIIN